MASAMTGRVSGDADTHAVASELPHNPHCFGGGRQDPHGHQLEVEDAADGTVTSRHVFDARNVGAPGIAHGGAVLAVLDELLSYLLFRMQELAVTQSLDVHYFGPVRLGVPYLLHASVGAHDGRKLLLSAQLRDEVGTVVVAATALSLAVDAAHDGQLSPAGG